MSYKKISINLEENQYAQLEVLLDDYNLENQPMPKWTMADYLRNIVKKELDKKELTLKLTISKVGNLDIEKFSYSAESKIAEITLKSWQKFNLVEKFNTKIEINNDSNITRIIFRDCILNKEIPNAKTLIFKFENHDTIYSNG